MSQLKTFSRRSRGLCWNAVLCSMFRSRPIDPLMDEKHDLSLGPPLEAVLQIETEFKLGYVVPRDEVDLSGRVSVSPCSHGQKYHQPWRPDPVLKALVLALFS